MTPRTDTKVKATFEAGPLGLQVATSNRSRRLCVVKASGQAVINGVKGGDEIIAVNDQNCRYKSSRDFKDIIVAAGRPFVLTVLRSPGLWLVGGYFVCVCVADVDFVCGGC
jgi:hypothetical protein